MYLDVSSVFNYSHFDLVELTGLALPFFPWGERFLFLYRGWELRSQCFSRGKSQEKHKRCNCATLTEREQLLGAGMPCRCCLAPVGHETACSAWLPRAQVPEFGWTSRSRAHTALPPADGVCTHPTRRVSCTLPEHKKKSSVFKHLSS